MAHCPSCGESNIDGAKFCAHCGTGLGDQCPNCGSALPGEVAFCPSCGTNLHVSQSQERRFITVLFVDLVGFTAESDEADPVGESGRAEEWIAIDLAPGRRSELAVATANATLAEARGNYGSALVQYEDLITGWDEFGHVLETGLAYYGAARCLSALDQDPAEVIATARGFDDLGALPILAEIDGSTDLAWAL